MVGYINKSKSNNIFQQKKEFHKNTSKEGGQFKPFEAEDVISTRAKLFGTDEVFKFKNDRVRLIGAQKPINHEYAGKVYDFSPENLANKIKGMKDPVKVQLLTEKYAELHHKYPHGVPFTGTGHPDFSKYAVKKVEVPFSGKSSIDIQKANNLSGLNSTPEGFRWHHNHDDKTLMLIPRDLHETIRHTGGDAIMRAKQ